MLDSLLRDIVSERQSSFRGCDVVVIDTKQCVEAIRQSVGLDYRAQIESSETVGSLFDGIEFDPQKIRTFTIGIFDKESPIGVLSVAITPKSIFKDQKYFQKMDDGTVVLRTFSDVIATEMPEYIINPAWTKLNEKYREQAGTAGALLLRKIISTISETCPESLAIEAIAQGQFFPDDINEYNAWLSSLKSGLVIDLNQLKFDPEIIGKSRDQSVKTVKFARFLDLSPCPNIGQANTLGPVFYRRVK